MQDHAHCAAVGKFDCDFDERIHAITLESGEGSGDVESPSGWFCPVDLDEDEVDLVTHYGTRWLMALENSQGFFTVLALGSKGKQSWMLDNFERAYEAWEEVTF